MCLATDLMSGVHHSSDSQSEFGGHGGSFEEHPNKDTICTIFGVDEIENIPGYEKGCMFFVENTYSVSTGVFSFVRGKTIVMDQDRYCEYVFGGCSPGLSFPGCPGDATISQGIVYGVNSPDDYSGLFGGITANMVVSGAGGAISPNGVSAKILYLEGYVFPSFGVSGTYYIQGSSHWIYGKAPVEIHPSRFIGFFNRDPVPYV